MLKNIFTFFAFSGFLIAGYFALVIGCSFVEGCLP